jgi:6-phosphogluconolactonase (cycloisomerase 2 family)
VGSGNIYVYTINQSTGALTTGTTVSAGTYPNPVTVATVNGNQYAYVSNKGSNDIYIYSIGTGGALTALTSIATGSLPNPVKVDSSGHYAYVSSAGDGKIYAYTIDQTATSTGGELTPVGAY